MQTIQEAPVEYQIHTEILQDHEQFHKRYKTLIAPLLFTPGVRMLSYGTEIGAVDTTLFDEVPPVSTAIAYAPGCASMQEVRRPVYWVGEEPKGEFHLLILSFSLHHLTGTPQEELLRLKQQYKSRYLLIVDYDFPPHLSAEEFRQRFVTFREQREVRQLFHDDWETAYTFHTRYGKSAYEDAVKASGYTIRRVENGRNTAQNKFFIFAEDPKQHAELPARSFIGLS